MDYVQEVSKHPCPKNGSGLLLLYFRFILCGPRQVLKLESRRDGHFGEPGGKYIDFIVPVGNIKQMYSTNTMTQVVSSSSFFLCMCIGALQTNSVHTATYCTELFTWNTEPNNRDRADRRRMTVKTKTSASSFIPHMRTDSITPVVTIAFLSFLSSDQ